jgi:hypothetical protein
VHVKEVPNFHVHGKDIKYMDNALFCLTAENKLRKAVVWLIEWKWFDQFLTLCILINALNIASSDYSWRDTVGGV